MGRVGDVTPGTHGWAPAVLGSLGAVATALLTLALTRGSFDAWPGTGRVPAAAAVLGAVLPIAAVLSGYLTVLLALAAAHVRPRPQPSPAQARRTAPRQVRLVSAALIALAGALTSPLAAQAAPTAPVAVSAAGSGPGTTVTSDADEPVPVPGWTPTRAVAEPRPSGELSLVGGRSQTQDPGSQEVVVRRGDTLWDLAARHLGPEATDADVAEEWPRWYAANRDVLGEDPDLILPGQRLLVPGADGVGR